MPIISDPTDPHFDRPIAGELTIPCPQHPLAAEPCCLFCGGRDGRTKAGSLYCHDCIEAGVQGARQPTTR